MIHKLFVTLLISFFGLSLHGQDWTRDDIPSYDKFEDFEALLHKNNDTTYVVNFWATWCGPCVKELPYFEALNDIYKNEKLKVVLVSLDFKKMIDKKLLPFLNKNEIQSDVVLLLDSKETKWIDKVDESWSGAIPVTLFYNSKERLFFEKSFHSTKELTDIINPILN